MEFLPTDISPQFFDNLADDYGLSQAELEVFSLVLQVESPSAIADTLSLTNTVVRKRLSNVYSKVGIEGQGPVKFAKLQKRLISDYSRRFDKISETNGSTQPPNALSPSSSQPNSIDWNTAPDVSRFTGRTQELSLLNYWMIEQQCRLVGIFGLQGIGKTTLTMKIAQQVQEQFEYIVWRSLVQVPPPHLLFSQLIEFFYQQQNLTYQPGKRNLNEQIIWLTSYLRSHRCLIILDGFDVLFKKEALAGTYRKGYEAYGQFLWRFAHESSKSCCLVTSREKSRELSVLEETDGKVHSLSLKGLDDGAYSLLENKSLFKQESWHEFINIYQGNPLMLKLAAMTIQEVFEGNVADFLATTRLTEEITTLITDILTRLSSLEYRIITVMGREEESTPIRHLQRHLSGVAAKDTLQGIQSLKMRSLIENTTEGFRLMPLVKEVIQAKLTE